MMSTPPPYRNFVNRRCVPNFQHGKVVTLRVEEWANIPQNVIESLAKSMPKK